MTNLDLISAIGAVGEQTLEHSERSVSGRRRVAVKLLCAAAVIALLTTTVLAAPAIRNALFGVKTKNIVISGIIMQQGELSDLSESYMDVSLELQMLPEAPETVETYYAPTLPAEQWEPIPLTVNEGAELSFAQDTLLQWENENGEYLLFRQAAHPGYTGDCSWDSVCTGFDAEYSVSQLELGGCCVQRIVVEPSAKEHDGLCKEHPGLQKLYWSDGLYIFSMEVNYAMPDEELATIFESIQPVADALEYVEIEYKPVSSVRPTTSLHLERVLLPETLPEGYGLTVGYKNPDGGFGFSWDKFEGDIWRADLYLAIETQGVNDDSRYIWETHYILNENEGPQETMERDVNGIIVTCYQNDFRAQIFWSFDGADYSLKSFGYERFSAEELLQIMEELVAVDMEDVTPLLKN